MESSHKNIAILGATSHIAKGLIYGFHLRGAYELTLFARSPDKARDFLKTIDCLDHTAVMNFESFPNNQYDVIINCVGIGDPGKLQGAESSIFRLTETYDNLILDYVDTHAEAWHINLSSGTVYGTDFTKPAGQSTRTTIDVNNISPSDYYGISKLNAESKHRAFPHRNIVDLRVFSYFSCFTDFQAKFMLNEILLCVQQGKTFETGPDNIIRDYVHRDDLCELIEACIAQKALNDVFDVYSLKPVAKFDILDFFSREYGLKYTIKDAPQGFSPTGSKGHYYSTSRKAQKIGYSPKFSSLECIEQESKKILAR